MRNDKQVHLMWVCGQTISSVPAPAEAVGGGGRVPEIKHLLKIFFQFAKKFRQNRFSLETVL